MRIDVYHHIRTDEATDDKLNQILGILQEITQKEGTMSQELDVLTAQVKATTDLETSAVQLIEGLASQIAALKDDPAKLQALSDSLKASADTLFAAVVANTPVAPPAPEQPA